ncbi:MAG TPA: DnaJ C-terminal domain-containing protein [Rhizomicrobium sp.]|nr:DnaJ C-terminal domain-containing protein [Rhizomicrobium sp.]
MRDPYDVLGVPKKASEAEIKKAFRALAKKHHPDTKGGDAAAQKKFQEISAAYDIVGDKDKRAKFDAGEIDAGGNPRGFDPGAHGFRGGPFGGGGGAGGGPRDFHFTWTDQDGDQAQQGFSAEDLFSDLLGGLGGRGGGRQARQGQDFSVQMTVSFEEAARGGSRRVMLANGEQIDVKIPAGIKDGQQIRLKGRGGAGRRGGPAGDVMIQIAVAAHPYFTRDGNNLRMDLPITLQEAVIGGKVPVPTLTGTVHLSVPAGSNTGSILRLKGKGIPAEPVGDLYVKLVVALPDAPDEALRKFALDWKNRYDPRTKLK